MVMTKHFVCHFVWASTDLERTKEFLSGLFGWEFRALSEDYMLFDLPEGPDGGLIKVDEVLPSNSSYIYIEVDRIEPYLEKAEELGGEVTTGKTEIPSLGWYAHINDPDGNIIGIFQYLENDEEYD